MRKIAGILLMMGMLVAGGPMCRAQAAAGPQSAERAGGGGQGAGQPTATPDTRTEKQKALAMQTDRLFAMATELKAQVELTNKNILSLKVVQKAEEIEALAKGMRGQGKK